MSIESEENDRKYVHVQQRAQQISQYDPETIRAASIQSQRIYMENASNVPTEVVSKRADSIKIYE